MGKREERRDLLKARILKSAGLLFGERGFFGVSMKEIAEAAGVGTGTAYNYFGSKAELFLLIASDALETEGAKNRSEAGESGALPMERIKARLNGDLISLKAADKRLLRDSYAIFAGGIRLQPRLSTLFFPMDEKIEEELIKLLGAIKKDNGFKPDFDEKLAGRMIHILLSQFAVEYIGDDSMTYEAFQALVMSSVEFLLEDKIAKRE